VEATPSAAQLAVQADKLGPMAEEVIILVTVRHRALLVQVDAVVVALGSEQLVGRAMHLQVGRAVVADISVAVERVAQEVVGPVSSLDLPHRCRTQLVLGRGMAH
jgi:hypothetical protein